MAFNEQDVVGTAGIPDQRDRDLPGHRAPPPARVFRSVPAKCGHLAHWWGPAGITTTRTFPASAGVGHRADGTTTRADPLDREIVPTARIAAAHGESRQLAERLRVGLTLAPGGAATRIGCAHGVPCQGPRDAGGLQRSITRLKVASRRWATSAPTSQVDRRRAAGLTGGRAGPPALSGPDDHRRAALSCRPRPSRSQMTAGTTRHSSKVRTMTPDRVHGAAVVDRRPPERPSGGGRTRPRPARPATMVMTANTNRVSSARSSPRPRKISPPPAWMRTSR